jgi:hypothetical protein
VGSGVDSEFDVLLAPWRLLGALRFAPVGRAVRAKRPVIVADAWPRPDGERGRPSLFALRELGHGADRFRLEFDADRGIVLAGQAFATGELFRTIEAVEVEIDGDFDWDLFVFRPPEGEAIQGTRRDRHLLRPTSIPEAQAAAPFTVLDPMDRRLLGV